MESEEGDQSFPLYPITQGDSRGNCPDILPFLTFQRGTLCAPVYWRDETSANASVIPASSCRTPNGFISVLSECMLSQVLKNNSDIIYPNQNKIICFLDCHQQLNVKFNLLK